MTCPECGEPFIDHGGETTTLVGYGREPNGHDHDDNCLKRVYRCANGHHTKLSIRRRCVVDGCGWVGKSECFCHPGQKIDEWPDGEMSYDV